MPKSPSSLPIEIKISTVVAISTILHSADPIAIDAALKQMTGGVSDFFEDEFAVIDVADMDALVHIAEHYDRSILCERTPEGEAFWVTDESGQFRYLIGAAAAAVCQPVPAEALAPLEVPVPDAQLFTQELNLGGGVISAYAAQEAPVAAPPEPEPLPEPVPEPLPAAQESCDLVHGQI